MKYTRVRRAVSAVVIDSWDKDRNPEHIKVNGNVTFTPLLKAGDVVQWAGPNGPESLVLAPIQCRISDGIIMHRGGEGVYLAAGGKGCEPDLIQWKAEFSSMQAGGWAFKLKPIMFDAVPDGEVDLTMIAPIAGASEPIVRGPAGTGIDNIKVDGAELVITARSEAGVFEMARIPLEDVVRAEAAAAAKSAADSVRTQFTTAASNAAASAKSAATSAQTATTKASEATTQASNAKTSATAAKTSETNAASSASAAATSASQAAGSAASAKSDADRAANVANSTSWSGDKLTVNGKTSPSLTGPPGTTTWAGITDKPSTFPPEGHTHRVADISDMPTVSDAPINRTIVQRSEVGTIRAADPQGPNNVTTQKYVDTAVGAKADKSHKHTVTDISDLPAIDKSNKGSSLVQRWADGTISVPSNPGTSDDSATSKWYVDTAVATEKARTVGMVWMVETEDASRSKESSCQKGDFIQVAQTGNIYQVV